MVERKVRISVQESNAKAAPEKKQSVSLHHAVIERTNLAPILKLNWIFVFE